MGIEQGTPVVGSSIESPRNIDLFDPRLPRAFKVWTDFKTRYKPQVLAIATLPLEQVIALGDELSISVGKAIGIDIITTDQPRGINKEKMVTLSESVSGDGNRVIFMRHGEQSPPEWISSIPDPTIRKIRMMQNPFNREDSLTNRGFVDVFTTAFGLLYLQKNTGRSLHIISSENARAKEVAEIVSVVIPGTTFATEEQLNSISYRDEYDDPPLTLEQLSAELPSGIMPWDPKLVDRLCKRTMSGLSQSEVIIRIVADLMRKGTTDGGNDLMVVFTHTQQLAEVLRSTGRLQDSDVRFPELTMLTYGKSGACQIFPRGVLADQDISQRYQLSLFNFDNLPDLLYAR